MEKPSAPPLPSERSFGALFSALFAFLAAWAAFKGAPSAQVWGCALLALALALLSLLKPALLRPANRAWFQLGLLLNRIVSPLVLGMIFFGLLTPVALLARAFGRDELRLKRRALESYWIPRQPPGPDAESFKHPF